MTLSGVYYLPFTLPFSPYGSRGFALHVADGSEIIARHIGGRHLTIFVGSGGRERYGACLRRLGQSRLADSYLPILDTSYVDGGGVRYRQESFVGRPAGTKSLVSFAHVTADARGSSIGAVVRFVASSRGLRVAGDRLISGAATALVFSHGGIFDGSAVGYRVRSADRRVRRLDQPARPCVRPGGGRAQLRGGTQRCVALLASPACSRGDVSSCQNPVLSTPSVPCSCRSCR